MIEVSACVALCLICFLAGVFITGLAFLQQAMKENKKTIADTSIDEHAILDGIGEHHE